MSRVFFVSFFLLLVGFSAFAEPCLLLYPLQDNVFRFDPSRYTLLSPGDPNFDPLYARAGKMLWDPLNHRIPYEVYQSPGLQGFEESTFGRNEFYVIKRELDLVIDGFHHAPRHLSDIYVRFIPVPPNALVEIQIDGVVLNQLSYHIPYLLVTTPLSTGFYSDTLTLDIKWTGAIALQVTAFADKNGNRVYDGEPCFSAYLEDPSVPTEKTTWGRIKSLYGD